MDKPILDITPKDASFLSGGNGRIVIEINQEHLNFVVLDKTNAIIAIRYYQFSARNHTDTAGHLQNIIASDDILSKNLFSCTVIYNYPESVFVPDEHFYEEDKHEMMELIHGDVQREVIHSERIPGWGIHNVYLVPPPIHESFKKSYPSAKCCHYYSAWLRSHVKEGRPQQVRLMFFTGKIIAAVFIENIVQVVQTFHFAAPEDALFHIMNIYQQFELSHEHTTLHISGVLDKHATLYAELDKYFVIETDTLPPGLTTGAHIENFPVHFFSSFLKMAICVS